MLRLPKNRLAKVPKCLAVIAVPPGRSHDEHSPAGSPFATETSHSSSEPSPISHFPPELLRSPFGCRSRRQKSVLARNDSHVHCVARVPRASLAASTRCEGGKWSWQCHFTSPSRRCSPVVPFISSHPPLASLSVSDHLPLSLSSTSSPEQPRLDPDPRPEGTTVSSGLARALHRPSPCRQSLRRFVAPSLFIKLPSLT